jgi:hypothetical protein
MSQAKTDFWPLLMEIHDLMWQARRAYFGTPLPFRELVQEFEVQPQQAGTLAYLLQNYNPQAISAAHYLERNAYDKPESLTEQYAQMAETGLLSDNGDEAYRVTDKGLAFYQCLEEMMNSRWDIPTLAGEEMEQLSALLRRVHEAMVNAPEPPLHWSVTTRARYGLNRPRGSHLGDLYDQIYDLWAYRDDSHLAAWRPYRPVSARTWETFTHVWNGKGTSLAMMVEKLQKQDGRGFTAEEYQASLDELVTRGWLEAADEEGHYRPSAAGQQLRDKAERLTNDFFYVPWSCLGETETADLRNLLTQLWDRLKQIAEGQ